MGPPKPGENRRKPAAKLKEKTLKRKREAVNIDELQRQVEELDAKNGDFTNFSSLPLSKATRAGLEATHFRSTTEIQQKAIPLALKGSDILGAAKTGSGKTLAFLVPALEKLYRQRWTELDGVGVLIISPTRELAIQIFEVLRKIGRYHVFSAGLVIGGKSLQDERERLGRMNILVCTPGRMLQHMDQTADLDIGNLQVLVLDEADRIMDMGFQSTVDALIEHLPKTRQTLLFSATQTKKVSDLARLSLKDPEYVAVHQKADQATPATLQQHYIVTPLPQKLDTLWSFLRANTKAKVLVFLSSGKQVRFVYETFRHLQPGISLLHLHGRQKQTARLDITKRFSSTQHACLLATDVVARGLDFPAVDWVIQLDCPEDVDTYIHRVGRTARYESEGRAVLFLEPSEEQGMLERMRQKKIPIEMLKVRQKKQHSIKNSLQNICFKDPEIKYLGQKAFISYVRSVYVQKDKEVFKVQELPLEEFAASIGLPGAPKIKFQKGVDVKAIKNRPRAALSSDDEDEAPKGKELVRTKYDRMFERQNQDVLAPHRQKIIEMDDKQPQNRVGGIDNEDEDDFLSVRRRLDSASVGEAESHSEASVRLNTLKGDKPAVVKTAGGVELPIDSNRRTKLLKSKKALLKYQGRGTKLVYDDEGNAHEVYEMEDEDAFRKRGLPEEQRQQFVTREAAIVQEQDVVDRKEMREKRREKKEKRKAKAKAGALVDAGNSVEEDGNFGVPIVPYEDFGGAENEDTTSETRSIREEVQPKKTVRKWFQDAPEDDEDDAQPRKKKTKRLVEDAETLEDLEMLAKSYL